MGRHLFAIHDGELCVRDEWNPARPKLAWV